MTTISLLSGTWEYQFEDEFIGSATTGTRMIKYISGGVISTNALYSAIAAATDEFQAMGFKNPMLPVTPNQYTLENQAFISRASTEWLKEGTIVADWSIVGVVGNNSGRGVIRVPYTDNVSFVSGDIGDLVTSAAGDTGTLLDFEVEPDGTKVLWIRPDDSTPITGDNFDNADIITSSGTGVSAGSTAGTSGQTTFTAIQAIGSVPSATEVYIVQDRYKLANSVSDTGFQFWSTNTAVSLGIISVLIRTESADILIAGQDLEVFARKYGSLYDNFRLNVAAGGFSALPLASAPDINNTTGYRTVACTGGSGNFDVGNGIYQPAGSWAAATARGVITGGTDLTTASPTFEYYLVGDLVDFSNGTDDVIEFDFVTQADGDALCTDCGTPGITDGGPEDTDAGEGGSCTITIGYNEIDHDNTGDAEPYSIQIDTQGDVPIAKVYEYLKYVTRRGADTTIWDTIACTIPGEQWHGIDATIYFDAGTGLVEGEDVWNQTQSGHSARVIGNGEVTTGEGVSETYFTLSDQQTSLITSISDGNVIGDHVDTPTHTQTVNTGGAGGAIIVHSSIKSSPFGSFTGTEIFGAPGVSFIQPHTDDTQSYKLTDDLGTLRTPPNTISFIVANTRLGDRILVARDTGTSGVIDKDTYTSHNTTNIQDGTTFEVTTSLDSQVPPVGVIRVVETGLQEEHRYYYSSWSSATDTFTLKPITTTTPTITSNSTTQLIDDQEDFDALGVEVGMLIRNTFGGKTTHIWEVTGIGTAASGILDVKVLYGTPDDWDIGDTYEINTLIQTYDNTDYVFALILDYEEDTGTNESPGVISNDFVKVLDVPFNVVVQVRQGADILPFEQNQAVGNNSITVTAVRADDTIA